MRQEHPEYVPPYKRPLRTPLRPLLDAALSAPAAAESRLAYLAALASRAMIRRRPAGTP
jgi:hypothetical protein